MFVLYYFVNRKSIHEFNVYMYTFNINVVVSQVDKKGMPRHSLFQHLSVIFPHSPQALARPRPASLSRPGSVPGTGIFGGAGGGDAPEPFFHGVEVGKVQLRLLDDHRGQQH